MGLRVIYMLAIDRSEIVELTVSESCGLLVRSYVRSNQRPFWLHLIINSTFFNRKSGILIGNAGFLKIGNDGLLNVEN